MIKRVNPSQGQAEPIELVFSCSHHLSNQHPPALTPDQRTLAIKQARQTVCNRCDQGVWRKIATDGQYVELRLAMSKANRQT